jgi:hypothetical protein
MMRPGAIRVCALAAALALACAAGHGQAPVRVSSPTLAYVFDSHNGAVLPIRGIAGSSTIGNPVDTGFPIAQALSLDASHMLASTEQTPGPLVMGFASTPPSVTPIAGISWNPTLAVASLRGKGAALYNKQLEAVWVVTGLPEAPAVARTVDVSGRTIKRLAVSDDGNLLVYASAERDGEVVYASTRTLDHRLLMTTGSIGGLALTARGDAIVVDRVSNEAFAVWDAGGDAVRQLLAGDQEGISSPTGIAVSSNGRLYVANAGAGTVTVLTPDGHFLKTLECACSISGVYPAHAALFRLTDRFDRSVFLLDTDSSDDQILFAPNPENLK